MPEFHRYLRIFFLTAASLLGLAASVVFFVDPFGVYQSPKIAGFNKIKPEIAKHESLAKAYLVRAYKPAGLVIGTSRSDFGLDPAHPGWAASAQPVYNSSISGGGIYEAMRYFQHALAASEIKQVILSLDMSMFSRSKSTPGGVKSVAPGFSEERLLSAASGQRRAVSDLELWKMLLSFDALNAARNTLGHQNDLSAQIYLDNGLTYWRDAATWLRTKESHHAQFGYMERMFANKVWWPDTEQRWKFDDPTDPQPSLELFRAIVKLAHAGNIDLRIIISPAHARMWEVLKAAGLWRQWGFWKRALLGVLMAEAKTANATPFPLWDFSGHNSITTEDFPPLASKRTMRWYWDGSHYTKEAGDLILDRIFGHNEPGRRVPDDFGVLLTPDNIEAHLAALGAQREAYALRHPRAVNEAHNRRVKSSR